MKPLIKDTESLKGLFYIVKGSYSKKEPKVTIDNDTKYIGGFNPEDDTNDEWYMVKDNITYYCICSSHSLDKCLEAVRRNLKEYKTRKEYFRQLSKISSEDYYEVHYLGRPPLTPEQRAKKVVGRCPRVSPIQKKLEEAIFNEYGHYYRDLIEEVEEQVYEDLNQTPYEKFKKRSLLLPKKRPSSGSLSAKDDLKNGKVEPVKKPRLLKVDPLGHKLNRKNKKTL